jgi:hypothetical protein
MIASRRSDEIDLELDGQNQASARKRHIRRRYRAQS